MLQCDDQATATEKSVYFIQNPGNPGRFLAVCIKILNDTSSSEESGIVKLQIYEEANVTYREYRG